MTMPPPTPVPSVRNTLEEVPLLTPATLSAKPATVASLSIKTGLLMYFCSSLRRGTSFQPTQFFERTLDDSANRRIAVSESFLGVDAILNVMLNVCDGLVVYPKVIHARVMSELPFMATENILMDAVKRGGDRQQLHERLRIHSQAAGNVVKEEGLPNDLLSRIAADPLFQTTEAELQSLLDPTLYTGRSAQQVDEFLSTFIRPLLAENAALLGEHETLTV